MTQSTPTNFRLQGALQQRGAIVLSTAVMVLLFQVACVDFGRVEMTEESFANGDGYTWGFGIEPVQPQARLETHQHRRTDHLAIAGAGPALARVANAVRCTIKPSTPSSDAGTR